MHQRLPRAGMDCAGQALRDTALAQCPVALLPSKAPFLPKIPPLQRENWS